MKYCIKFLRPIASYRVLSQTLDQVLNPVELYRAILCDLRASNTEMLTGEDIRKSAFSMVQICKDRGTDANEGTV